MAVAARTFGRRVREDQGATNTAASLGAVLELLRALNWMIRADVPWPTKRGQSFDFVLVGEPGAFALWVTDGEPAGVEDAAAGLSPLLGGTRVRPIVCRSSTGAGAQGTTASSRRRCCRRSRSTTTRSTCRVSRRASMATRAL